MSNQVKNNTALLKLLYEMNTANTLNQFNKNKIKQITNLLSSSNGKNWNELHKRQSNRLKIKLDLLGQKATPLQSNLLSVVKNGFFKEKNLNSEINGIAKILKKMNKTKSFNSEEEIQNFLKQIKNDLKRDYNKLNLAENKYQKKTLRIPNKFYSNLSLREFIQEIINLKQRSNDYKTYQNKLNVLEGNKYKNLTVKELITLIRYMKKINDKLVNNMKNLKYKMISINTTGEYKVANNTSGESNNMYNMKTNNGQKKSYELNKQSYTISELINAAKSNKKLESRLIVGLHPNGKPIDNSHFQLKEAMSEKYDPFGVAVTSNQNPNQQALTPTLTSTSAPPPPQLLPLAAAAANGGPSPLSGKRRTEGNQENRKNENLQKFRNEINNAKTTNQLNNIQQRIKNSGIENTRLNSIIQNQRNQLQAAAAATKIQSFQKGRQNRDKVEKIKNFKQQINNSKTTNQLKNIQRKMKNAGIQNQILTKHISKKTKQFEIEKRINTMKIMANPPQGHGKIAKELLAIKSQIATNGYNQSTKNKLNKLVNTKINYHKGLYPGMYNSKFYQR